MVGRDGAVVVEGVAGADLLDRIEAELQPFLQATPTGPDDFSGNRTRRTGSLIARSPAARDLVMHPLALGTAGTFLGHATNFQLHLTQAIAIGAGSLRNPSTGTSGPSISSPSRRATRSSATSSGP